MPSPPRIPPRARLAAKVALAVLAVDQASKAWAWAQLRGALPRDLLPGLVHLDFAFNPGASFGVGRDWRFAGAFFFALALSLSAALVVALLRNARSPRLGGWAVGLAVGGALGNATDRIARVHHLAHLRDRELEFHDYLAHADQVAAAYATHDPIVRIPTQGVIDFIVVDLGPAGSFPAFNLADLALSIASGLLVGWIWRNGAVADDAEPEGRPARDDAAGA